MKNINVQVGWYYIQPSHWCDRVVLIIIGLVYICIAQYSRFYFRSKLCVAYGWRMVYNLCYLLLQLLNNHTMHNFRTEAKSAVLCNAYVYQTYDDQDNTVTPVRRLNIVPSYLYIYILHSIIPAL